MAFPLKVVGQVCDVFLQRTLELMATQYPTISKVHYGILTLKLLVEKNEDALCHISSKMTEKHNDFLKIAFQFMLTYSKWN